MCLFGVRVGASLAAVAAQGRTDVHAMIAFAPVIKVSSYLREIRALSLARSEPTAASLNIDPELQEAAGFTTTAETRAALSTIDLGKLGSAPAASVLALERDDMPINDAWPKKLASHGADVEQRHLAGYVDMMRDAHASKVPHEAITSALDWLVARDGSAGPRGPRRRMTAQRPRSSSKAECSCASPPHSSTRIASCSGS